MPLTQRQIADVHHALTQHPDATFGAVYDWIRYTYADITLDELLILHQQYQQTINAPSLSGLDFSELPARTLLYMAAVEEIHRERGTIAHVRYRDTVHIFGEEVHVGGWLNSVRYSGNTSAIPARQQLLNKLTRLRMRWGKLEMTSMDLLLAAVRQIHRQKGTIANVQGGDSVKIDGRDVPVGAWLQRVRTRGGIGSTLASQDLLDELTHLGMDWGSRRTKYLMDDELTRAVTKFYSNNPKGRIKRSSVENIETADSGQKKIPIGRIIDNIVDRAKRGGKAGGVPEAVYEILKQHKHPKIAHLEPTPPARAPWIARGGGAIAPGPGRAAVDRGSARQVVSDGGDVVSSVVLVRLKGSTDWQYWRVDHHADGTLRWWRPGLPSGSRLLKKLPAGATVLGAVDSVPAAGGGAGRAADTPQPSTNKGGNCFYDAVNELTGQGSSHAAALALRARVRAWLDSPAAAYMREIAD
ncbi:hypothetical protein, partial [Streptomyces fructofermentans]|uniref:hypothetical protein n=1 Tax=Streptomyces fructofermentans TaxID=152141 RepID=UPI0037A24046